MRGGYVEFGVAIDHSFGGYFKVQGGGPFVLLPTPFQQDKEHFVTGNYVTKKCDVTTMWPGNPPGLATYHHSVPLLSLMVT